MHKDLCALKNADEQPNQDASDAVNWDSVLFHEEHAATLGCLDAIQCMYQYYLGLMINGPLANCPLKIGLSDAFTNGLTYISAAVLAGDRFAMHYLAELNYHGKSDEKPYWKQDPNWVTAVHWYEMLTKTLNQVDDSSEDKCNAGYESLTDWPVYRIQGRLAEMYETGGHGLKQDLMKACKSHCFEYIIIIGNQNRN